jgi:hypothetical protein
MDERAIESREEHPRAVLWYIVGSRRRQGFEGEQVWGGYER